MTGYQGLTIFWWDWESIRNLAPRLVFSTERPWRFGLRPQGLFWSWKGLHCHKDGWLVGWLLMSPTKQPTTLWQTYVQKTMENHIFLMGKSSISRAIFNSYVRNYQRVTNLTSWFKWRLAQKKQQKCRPKSISKPLGAENPRNRKWRTVHHIIDPLVI